MILGNRELQRSAEIHTGYKVQMAKFLLKKQVVIPNIANKSR